MKQVTVAVKMTQEFVAILRAHVELTYPGAMYGKHRGELTPGAVLAIALLAEARGGLEEQVASCIPNNYRACVQVVHSLRTVEES